MTRELQLLVKNGRLTVLDPALPMISDGVIVDSADGAEYMTVLANNGMLTNMKEPIQVPKDFRNSEIVQMSNNLHCSAPYVLLRYKNGSLLAFNYLTGKILSTETVKSDLSLFEYAKSFFQTKLNSMMSDLSDGYLEIAKLEKKLKVSPYLDGLDNLNQNEKADGENMGGTSDKHEISDEQSGEESTAGSEENNEQEVSAQKQDTIEEKEVPKDHLTEGLSTGTSISEGDHADLAKPVGSKKVSEQSTQSTQSMQSTQSTQSTASEATDLAKPDPLVRRYVPVYDAKSGEYLLYEEKNLWRDRRLV